MSHPTLFFYPRPRVDVAEVPALAHAGAVLLTDTIHATGLAASLREALDWVCPLAWWQSRGGVELLVGDEGSSRDLPNRPRNRDPR